METIDSLYYVLTDHHGSWEKVMDEGKNTGHEHHSHFGLINMKFTLSERSAKRCLSTAERCELGGANGRMYDPVMSSFLSVDQLVFYQTTPFIIESEKFSQNQ